MKKFIFFSVMTACMISFAAPKDADAYSAFEAAKAARGMNRVQDSAKSTIAIFGNNPSQKLIKIIETEKSREAARKALDLAEAVKKDPRLQNSGPGINETIGGGWQPEVSDMAKTLSGFINEISRNLGDGCTPQNVGVYVKDLPLNVSADVEIDISLLSQGAQICLRK